MLTTVPMMPAAPTPKATHARVRRVESGWLSSGGGGDSVEVGVAVAVAVEVGVAVAVAVEVEVGVAVGVAVAGSGTDPPGVDTITRRATR